MLRVCSLFVFAAVYSTLLRFGYCGIIRTDGKSILRTGVADVVISQSEAVLPYFAQIGRLDQAAETRSSPSRIACTVYGFAALSHFVKSDYKIRHAVSGKKECSGLRPLPKTGNKAKLIVGAGFIPARS
ncbi:hypothetical protein D0T90_04660 [Neisseria animalis]|uniref:Uncharacterized protein n=2 Tax=Neisseria animalis TaxID=492 RepID=A0A5P3MSW5_NEIAN|nr:hypothetical protein D0T90_04660 [Neisseria animalis]ROW32051.1 hypothetical protein CGZ60_06875 [Neisseria animalis]